MSAKWTEGPWVAKRSKSGRVHQILAPAGRGDFKSVRSITRWGAFIGSGTPEGEANALLCTAAPDLAEALMMIRDADEDCIKDGLRRPVTDVVRAMIDAALRKAGVSL